MIDSISAAISLKCTLSLEQYITILNRRIVFPMKLNEFRFKMRNYFVVSIYVQN